MPDQWNRAGTELQDETDQLDAGGVAAPPSFRLDSLLRAEYFRTAARNGSLTAVGCTFPLKISEKGTKLPYRTRVSSLSWVRDAPLRSIPAKRPRAREYVKTSALIFTSVSAAASRPTGPAAAEASAPSLNLLESRCCIP